MSISRHPAWGDFVRSFNKIAAHRHRYEVFRDFVTMAAISMHNAIRKDPALEAEYMQIVKRYEADQMSEICALFGKLVLLLDSEPQDVLGQLYMALELGNTQAGQFFTPPEISELMARMTYGDELRRRDVERAFGWGAEDGSSKTWLAINRGGASGVETTHDWQDFVK